jgi:hypothetical protein
MRALALSSLLLATATASAQPGLSAEPGPPPLGKAGYFHTGFSIDLLGLGAVQAITSHDHASGVTAGLALQWDLGPRWALRLPIELSLAGLSNGGGYGELALLPGAIYRFRDADDQRWVPYLGGGLRLASVGIGNTLINRPLVVACCHDWGDGHNGKPDPNVDSEGTTCLDLWAGVEWNRTSWFALQLAGSLGYERLAGVPVIIARELVALRLSF